MPVGTSQVIKKRSLLACVLKQAFMRVLWNGINHSAVYSPRYSVEGCGEHVLCEELSVAILATICEK